MKKIVTITLLCVVAALAQQKGTFKDPRDKKTYKTATIGEQTWMAENLNYADKDSKCYNNKTENCTKYGRLYSPNSELCPDGWHLPSADEWQILADFAGGGETAGKDLKAKSSWNKNGNGTDKFGFAALPGGYYLEGTFVKIGIVGTWWTSTSYRMDRRTAIIARSMGYDRNDFDQGPSPYGDYRSIRCLQNDEKYNAAKKAKEEAEAAAAAARAKEAEEKKKKADAFIATAKPDAPFKDPRDGKTYKTIKVGEQVWFAENLNHNIGTNLCYREKEDNCNKYGRLYDWEAAIRACPSGWHLPTKNEWEKLINPILPGYPETDKVFKSKSGWEKEDGVDAIGFSALPGGYRHRGFFHSEGQSARWWTADETTNEVSIGDRNDVYFSSGRKEDGGLLSVRCLQGEAGPEIKAKLEKYAAEIAPFKDTRDGKTYKKFIRGYKVWMAENLNYDAKGSKCYDNKPENCAKYGRLYDYETAKKSCPAGWRLPTRNEWPESFNLKTGSGWDNVGRSTPGSGTDEIGFSALPGGFYGSYFGSPVGFTDIGKSARWWVETPDANNLLAYQANISSNTSIGVIGNDKSWLFSVRCVSNTPATLSHTIVTPVVPQMKTR